MERLRFGGQERADADKGEGEHHEREQGEAADVKGRLAETKKERGAEGDEDERRQCGSGGRDDVRVDALPVEAFEHEAAPDE